MRANCKLQLFKDKKFHSMKTLRLEFIKKSDEIIKAAENIVKKTILLECIGVLYIMV